MGYKIRLTTSFKEFWRYNVALCCGCYDAQEQRCGFVAADSTIAPAGSHLAERPDDVEEARRLSFDVEDCHNIRLYLYIIPHTAPTSNIIGDVPPFDVKIEITHNKKCLYTKRHHINQWSGANINIELTRE